MPLETARRDVDVVGFIRAIISNVEPNGEKWSDLERSLGYLEVDDYFEDLSDDENPWNIVNTNQILADHLVGAILQIPDYFSAWIDTIDICDVSPKPDFEKLIDQENDLFLTFNYTRTLEEVYEAEDVCHIHGEQGEELLFGHGNDTDSNEENMSRNIGAEDELDKMQRQLKKDTAQALSDSQDFFTHISKTVDKIYSYGFSFSEVDQIYIQEICRKLSTCNVTWYLNDYDYDDQREKYKSIIRSCGFKGKFDTFHISNS